MKYLTKEIDWPNISHVGFDLDGTLYDEFDFIVQAYRRVLTTWSIDNDEIGNCTILERMLLRWIEKGSSYPRIFDETLDFLQINQNKRDEYLKNALDVFRSTEPILILSQRMEIALRNFKNKHHLFLITDGQPLLQQNKITSLGLNDFFNSTDIHILGTYGSEFSKPNTEVISKLSFSLADIGKDKIVYIGDRMRDQKFAKNCDIGFCDIRDLFIKH